MLHPVSDIWDNRRAAEVRAGHAGMLKRVKAWHERPNSIMLAADKTCGLSKRLSAEVDKLLMV